MEFALMVLAGLLLAGFALARLIGRKRSTPNVQELLSASTREDRPSSTR